MFRALTVLVCACLMACAGEATPGGNRQPPGGGTQPGGGGSGGASFTYDTFLTDSVESGGCIVYGTLVTGYVTGGSAVVIPSTVTQIADGAFAGDAALVSLDVTSATDLSEIPVSFANGCRFLTTVSLPTGVTAIDASAFAMDGLLAAFSGSGVTTVGDYAFYGCTSLVVSASFSPAADSSSFIGVSCQSDDGSVFASEAKPLVAWLSAGGTVASSLTTYPASMSTADLKLWLTNDVSNLEAYLYADEIASNANFRALSVSGTNFLFTAQDIATLGVINAALQVSTDLQSWTTVSTADLSDGVYALPSATNAFARIVYTLLW